MRLRLQQQQQQEMEDNLTIEQLAQQIAEQEKKLQQLKDQKHHIFTQLKSMLHVEDEQKRQAKASEAATASSSRPHYEGQHPELSVHSLSSQQQQQHINKAPSSHNLHQQTHHHHSSSHLSSSSHSSSSSSYHSSHPPPPNIGVYNKAGAPYPLPIKSSTAYITAASARSQPPIAASSTHYNSTHLTSKHSGQFGPGFFSLPSTSGSSSAFHPALTTSTHDKHRDVRGDPSVHYSSRANRPSSSSGPEIVRAIDARQDSRPDSRPDGRGLEGRCVERSLDGRGMDARLLDARLDAPPTGTIRVDARDAVRPEGARIDARFDPTRSSGSSAFSSYSSANHYNGAAKDGRKSYQSAVISSISTNQKYSELPYAKAGYLQGGSKGLPPAHLVSRSGIGHATPTSSSAPRPPARQLVGQPLSSVPAPQTHIIGYAQNKQSSQRTPFNPSYR